MRWIFAPQRTNFSSNLSNPTIKIRPAHTLSKNTPLEKEDLEGCSRKSFPTQNSSTKENNPFKTNTHHPIPLPNALQAHPKTWTYTLSHARTHKQHSVYL
ncbi:hypothetical protein [Bartonella sp. CM120XJJH]|uniref:hypothetical protein n=1 Tax=Bartonella sp. CM120XJJH TaxID=3243544 RepID=UPI0035CF93BD